MIKNKLRRVEILSKLLTTGQMIDQLKVGEIAEGVEGFFRKTQLTMTDYNEIVFVNHKDSTHNKFFKINSFTHKAKWIINPQYVTFEEAIEAMKEGKKVRIHITSGVTKDVTIGDNMIGMGLGEYGFYTFLKSKWSIED